MFVSDEAAACEDRENAADETDDAEDEDDDEVMLKMVNIADPAKDVPGEAIHTPDPELCQCITDVPQPAA